MTASHLPDSRLLEILACPSCVSPVEPHGDELWCTGCDLAFPVRDGIPVMLVEHARRRDSEPTGPDEVGA